MLIKKYSVLDLQYPVFSDEQIHEIPSSCVLDFSFDIAAKKIMINEKKMSQQQQFVFLYLQTIELIQIFIDIYNEFERKGKEHPLIPLKNGIGFIGTNRSLKNVSNTIDPHARDIFI